MKKFLLDLTVTSFEQLNDRYFLIKLFSDVPMPEVAPGQFVEVRVDHSPATYLRRPISIHFVDYDK
ncbi:MAG: dihydroorotate dehydrogenase electron transfer subunit, partial [Prevotella bivia]|nr:dihydroorotate dehydrogenase electron transfer subunit [Prevotella bivia]